MYKLQEKRLVWLAFIIAGIMLFSILGRVFGSWGGGIQLGNEEAVFFSRVLTETTLSFHIIYATIGVGVPLMIMIAQWVGIKKNDEHYIFKL